MVLFRIHVNVIIVYFLSIQGGCGQRKLNVVPPESEGYTAKSLKTASNNGKSTLYIVPLQDTIDTSPLPPHAAEFEKMPKSICKTCGVMMPLQVLALHIENCALESENASVSFVFKGVEQLIIEYSLDTFSHYIFFS